MRHALCVLICLAASAASCAGEPKLLHVLRGHEHSVRVLVFSFDSRLLASSQDGGEVRLWDARTGKNVGILYQDGDSYDALAFSPDGKTLAGGSDCRWVSVWDIGSRTRVGTIEMRRSSFPHAGACIAFRASGKTLLSWSYDSDSDHQASVLIDVATLNKTGAIKLNFGRGQCMVFSPNCRLFAVRHSSGAGTEDLIKLYETATGKELTTLKGHSDSATDLVFSADGRTIAAAVDGTAKIWGVATDRHISTFRGAGKYVCGVAFTPDGNTLAFGVFYDPVVELWDVSTSKKIAALKGKTHGTDGISNIAISPDGKLLAVGRSAGGMDGWDETIELWDIADFGNPGRTASPADNAASQSKR